MLSKEFKKSLFAIAQELEDNGIDYTLVGSVNSVLQGMTLSPRDIDFVVKFEDVDKALSCLAHFFIEEIHTPDRYILHLGVFGLDVQLEGNNNASSSDAMAFNARKPISFEGKTIFITPLNVSAEFYERVGFPQKAIQVREFLNKKK